ncbi:CueP family metal-binding protein [Aliagarivorans taiwanensis]|uniref:CueP family metal-binding protein n=1 Tax=Aliagarivorans taiwanensis TaxID=561966 RepID=UPI00041D053D|nr:CueP family metal-binding protein [Aliagarivorans taiwanensis]
MTKSLLIATLLGLTAHSALAMDASEYRKLSAEQALQQAHQWHRSGDASVKVLPRQIDTEFANGEKVSIPTESHLLSIAPFVNQTHPCTYHVPTGCQGELVDAQMHVMVKDLATGELVHNTMVRTQHDGFIDFWMPKDGRYEFMFHYGDLMASEVLSTDAQSRTCITTMQLTKTDHKHHH